MTLELSALKLEKSWNRWPSGKSWPGALHKLSVGLCQQEQSNKKNYREERLTISGFHRLAVLTRATKENGREEEFTIQGFRREAQAEHSVEAGERSRRCWCSAGKQPTVWNGYETIWISCYRWDFTNMKTIQLSGKHIVWFFVSDSIMFNPVSTETVDKRMLALSWYSIFSRE